MNKKLTLTTIICIAALMLVSSQHSYADMPDKKISEKFKIVYLTDTGVDNEARLNKLSAEGWKFKSFSYPVVIFTK